MPANALPHNLKKHWALPRLHQRFDPGALQHPAPSMSHPVSRASLFVSEIYRFWQDAIDGTLESVVFKVLCIDNYLAKLC